MNKEWFACWFDSPYYHILYKDRDEEEAYNFMEKLNGVLSLPVQAAVLDLACGKGRHSITLHKLGYRVLGADLSCSSIRQAKAFQTDGLEFIVHDMREAIAGRKFHAVFNLFTSFGYFEDEQDNHRVLTAVHAMLVDKGLLVLDFMNVDKVLRELVDEEHKIRDGIDFIIRRKQEGAFIVKEITFSTEERSFHYAERVRVLRESDFTSLLEAHGFQVLNRFGDFNLSTFDPVHSERLIIIARKN